MPGSKHTTSVLCSAMLLLLLASLLACGRNNPEENNNPTPNNTIVLNNATMNNDSGCVDADQDGYFVQELGRRDAECGAIDCDDSDDRAAPGNMEICGNGVDDDCGGDGDAVCDPMASCSDGVQNEGEEGVDCGGPCEAACTSATVDSFDIAGQGESAKFYAGTTFDLDLGFTIDASGCVNCGNQIKVMILDTDFPDLQCAYDRQLNQEVSSLTTKVTLDTPWDPGTYRLGFYYGNETDCDVFTDVNPKDVAIPFGTIEVVAPDLVANELKHSDVGQCIDVPNSSKADGVELIPFSCTSNPNQLWNIEYLDAFFYRIRNQNSGKCLTSAGSEEGAAILQSECDGSDEQTIRFFARDGGYALGFKSALKCIAVTGSELTQKDCESFDSRGDVIFDIVERPDLPMTLFIEFNSDRTQSLELSSDLIPDKWGFGNVFTIGGQFPGAIREKRTLTLEDVEFFLSAPTDCDYTIGVHQLRSVDGEVLAEFELRPFRATQGEGWKGVRNVDRRLVDNLIYFISIRADGICNNSRDGNSYVLSYVDELAEGDRRFTVGNYGRTAMYYDTSEGLPDFPDGPNAGPVSRIWSDTFTYKPVLMRLKIKAAASN